MPNDTITLVLEGELTVNAFAEALKAFAGIISGLSQEIGDPTIEWVVEDLQPGSAITTLRGRSSRPQSVERAVKAYAGVGHSLQQNQRLEHGKDVVRNARQLGRMVGAKVRTVRFETQDEEAVVSTPPKRIPITKPTLSLIEGPRSEPTSDRVSGGAWGIVEGVVETLTKRHGLRFTLYDSLNDRPVSCYLQEGQQEEMRGIWGKRAIIHGWVTRDPTDGHPVGIRRISSIEEAEDGDYTQARGAAPLGAGGLLPEEAIRRLRDE